MPQDHSGFGHLPTMAGHLFGPASRSFGDVAIVSVSRALALFLGLAASKPSKRRRGPLQPFTSSPLPRSMSKPCTGLYGALWASCEVNLHLPTCSSANSSFVTGDLGGRFDHSLSTKLFFLVFTLFLAPARN